MVAKKTVLILTQGRFGGTDFLLARLSNWLKLNHYDVDVVTPAETARLREYDIVFLPTSEIRRLWIFSVMSVKFKHVCIWCMGYAAFRGSYISISDEEYSQNISSKGPKVRVIEALKRRAQRALAIFLECESVVFTDEVGAFADLGELAIQRNIQGIICPIVIDKSPATHFEYSAPMNVLRLGWVGRVDMDFKFHALERVILDIRSLRERSLKRYSKIVFYVVGSGDAIDALKALTFSDLSMEYKLIPSVDKDELSGFIRENIDLMFAMGTSSLEAAKNKIPTIVVPPRACRNDSQVPPYRWVSESKGYSLGELSYAGVKPVQQSSSMEVLIEQFVDDAYGISCAAYEYSKLFDAELVFKKVVDLAGKSFPSRIMYVKSFELFVLNKLKAVAKALQRRPL
ncbi:hypothetical protein [Pseudomonas extremaustralis]|uniref:hypothetical protein n=1 Tax=Pseudomonas extremaustralis TaxID=359110 RepID=UPI0023DE9D6E|nr:hypothetical protein [Pseudomonas extremaustralis]MDF3134932.1 hypothetical protein [Pseudomonas extremaustralis]